MQQVRFLLEKNWFLGADNIGHPIIVFFEKNIYKQ